ncbi:MAG TPA: RagB/SusD family nutrient uptake outer membrane protein [Chitinophagaceae bacterium]|nr:RagB/SusD family nutrient uptake outer membrane protein [Chitinophagaceae bacterium]
MLLLRKYLLVSLLLACGIPQLACRRMVTAGAPADQLTPEKVYSTASGATAVLGNIYAQFEVGASVAANLNPLSSYADETLSSAGDLYTTEFNSSQLTPANSYNLDIWRGLYGVVYQCNAFLEGLRQLPADQAADLGQLTGEGLFLRGLAYYYLVSLYGDVPLLLSTDAARNSQAARTPAAEVMTRTRQDLEEAITLLSSTYPGAEKTRANKLAAQALLARVSLDQGDWARAEELASQVIQSGNYALEPNMDQVYRAGSPETILAAWNPFGYVLSGAIYITDSGVPPYYLTDDLYQSFEPADQRRSRWVGTSTDGGGTYYFPYKYKNRDQGGNPEYLCILGLAEQYLIRAESLARQEQVDEALDDLNAVRQRAGLSPVQGPVSQDSCLALILEERRHEWVGEWAHRFIDLKRLGLLDSVLGPQKPYWKSSGRNLPIPLDELNRDPNLTQNEGY